MKSLLAALGLLCIASTASAFEFGYIATTTGDAAVRDVPSQGGRVVTTVPAGTVVQVDVCFTEGEYCLGRVPGTLDKGGFIDGRLLLVDGGGGTVHEAERQRWARIRDEQARPSVFLSHLVRTEGDSYMAGAYGFALAQYIAKDLGLTVTNTAKGGSTIDEVVARIRDGSKSLLNDVTVIWDGSMNGARSAEDYVAQIGEAVGMLGHDHFLIVLPALPGQPRTGMADAVGEMIKAKWPDNYLDWRPIIPHDGGVFGDDQLAKPPEDRTHLAEAPLEAMAGAVADFIREKGW